MREQQTDLWTTPADAICITTNGYVKANGEAVMGRGCAKQAVERVPGVAKLLGARILAEGLHVAPLLRIRSHPPCDLLAFPVKYVWSEPADLELIERSARELMVWLAVMPKVQTVLLPRPGCGNGRRTWEKVRPILEPILDDRVVVVYV